jgi:hypothetical protein
MPKSFADDRRMSEIIIRSKLQEGRKLNVWELEYLQLHGLKHVEDAGVTPRRRVK